MLFGSRRLKIFGNREMTKASTAKPVNTMIAPNAAISQPLYWAIASKPVKGHLPFRIWQSTLQPASEVSLDCPLAERPAVNRFTADMAKMFDRSCANRSILPITIFPKSQSVFRSP
jgi:hypothetical protein